MGFKFPQAEELKESKEALKRTFKDLSLADMASIVAYAQRHECHKTTCLKNPNPMESTCKAGFPQKKADETFLEIEEKRNKAGELYLKLKMNVRRSALSERTNQYQIM